MNMEGKTHRVLQSIAPMQWRLSLALLFVTVSSAPSFSQGTAAQRVACTPDALRLCGEFIPNADQITTCLRGKNAELSEACRAAIEATMGQLPGPIDGTGSPKRAGR
jgi:hypothetical protein